MMHMKENGSTFGELAKSSYVNSDDLLLVSVKDSSNSYESKTISIRALAKQLNNDLEKCIDVGTAAYHSSNQYASAQHDHDIFTSATYTQTFSSGRAFFDVLSIQYFPIRPMSVMKISVDDSSSSIEDSEWAQAISAA